MRYNSKKDRCYPDLCDDFCPSDQLESMRDKVLEVAGLSEIFKVLGDETRTKILYLLAHRRLCVCDIAAILGISLPAVSHHLRLLKRSGWSNIPGRGKWFTIVSMMDTLSI